MRDTDSRWCYMRQLCGDVFDVVRIMELCWLGPNKLRTFRIDVDVAALGRDVHTIADALTALAKLLTGVRRWAATSRSREAPLIAAMARCVRERIGRVAALRR